MKILALDLGTETGWAISLDGQIVDCGTWKLATAKEITAAGKLRMNRRLDVRIPRFLDNLVAEHARGRIDWIVWEDVQFSSSTLQTQLWSSFRTVVWLFAGLNGIRTECLPVSSLKLFATGHGGATKEMMAKHLLTGAPACFFLDSTSNSVQFHRLGPLKILDDNAVDAVHLLKWAMKTLEI